MANGFFFVARRTGSRGKEANIDEQSTFETMLMQQVGHAVLIAPLCTNHQAGWLNVWKHCALVRLYIPLEIYNSLQ